MSFHRRVIAAVTLGVLAAACSNGSSSGNGAGSTAAAITTAIGGEAGKPTRSPVSDAVLAPLERVDFQVFTARYRIVRRLGPVEADAVVVQQPPNVSVTVGDVRILRGPDGDRTCTLSTHTCQTGVQEQALSNVAIGSAFFNTSAARALRVSTARATAAPTAEKRLIAGQEATCAIVPISPGQETYCSLFSGAIALWDTADKHIELTSFASTSENSAFTS
ncbi:MAG: hypothetical protein AB7L13_23760 [Acidimicrobiia bacterium]